MNYDAENAVRESMNPSSSVLTTKSACNADFFCFIVLVSFKMTDKCSKKIPEKPTA